VTRSVYLVAPKNKIPQDVAALLGYLSNHVHRSES
jgi:hypothetical protein